MKKPNITYKHGDGYWAHSKECYEVLIDDDVMAVDDIAMMLNGLIDALIETDKDLCVLEITMRKIEKKDHLAEGMADFVMKWRERNKQELKKAGCEFN